MPRIERLEQNTPEWRRWRMEGIGSSDAPVIMGEGAFKTRRAAVGDQDRTGARLCGQSGFAPGSRAGARRAQRLRA